MQIEQVSRVCPLLESDKPTRKLDYAPAPWVLLQCKESGFVFLENPPDYSHLEEDFAWEETFKKESDSRREAEPALYAMSQSLKRFRTQFLKRDKVQRLSTEVLAKRAEQHSDKLNVLDVGCADANLLDKLAAVLPEHLRSRMVPFGVEISKQLAAAAQAKLSKVGGACQHASAIEGVDRFDTDMFDLIVLSSFLEHEINPLPLLRLCQRTLKPGGNVIIKVPNFDSLNRHVRGNKWCGFRWPDHVNYFTPESLTAMAKKSGLQIARMNFADKHPLSDSMYCVLAKN